MSKILACPASCRFTNLLLVVSFLFPTSLMGDINPLLPAGAALVNLILLLMLVTKGKLVFLLSRLSLSILLLSLIVFYTLISEFDSYAWGQIFYLLPLIFLVSTSSKISLKMSGVLRVYYIASFFVIFLGYSILLKIKPLTEFVVGFYSYGYADLVPRMIELGKPVSIFGSHSIAAMYFYLIGLLAVYIQAKMQGSRLINIFIVFSIIVFLTNLQSASSAFFLMLSFVSYSYVWLSSRFKSKSFLYLFVFFCLSTFVFLGVFFGWFNFVFEKVVGSSTSGVISRYSSSALENNIKYILESPMSGIGFSYSPLFLYSDSDYILSLLKYGLLGAVVFYFLCIDFLYKNIDSRYFLSSLIILALLSFSVGYYVFTYVRFVPFVLLLFMLQGALGRRESAYS